MVYGGMLSQPYTLKPHSVLSLPGNTLHAVPLICMASMVQGECEEVVSIWNLEVPEMY